VGLFTDIAIQRDGIDPGARVSSCAKMRRFSAPPIGQGLRNSGRFGHSVVGGKVVCGSRTLGERWDIGGDRTSARESGSLGIPRRPHPAAGLPG